MLIAIIFIYLQKALQRAVERTTSPAFQKWVGQPCKWFGFFLVAALLTPFAIVLSPVIGLCFLSRLYKDWRGAEKATKDYAGCCRREPEYRGYSSVKPRSYHPSADIRKSIFQIIRKKT